MDWTQIAVAGITACGGVLGVTIPLLVKVERVHKEVRTNNGMRQHEYIEKIAADQTAILDLMAQHAEDDERKFAEVHARLDACGVPRRPRAVTPAA